jgi:hypothetical protein
MIMHTELNSIYNNEYTKALDRGAVIGYTCTANYAALMILLKCFSMLLHASMKCF